jgi:hypothetical protein
VTDTAGAYRLVAMYRDAGEDPETRVDPKLSTPAFWSDPPLGDSAGKLVGDSYGGYGIHAPFVITEPTAFLYAGTAAAKGTELAGVVAGDYDNYLPGIDPRNVEIVAHSPVVTSYGMHGHADATYYTDPTSQAGILATGTIGWIPAMTPCNAGTDCPATMLDQITANITRAFGSGPAGLLYPSAPNSSQYYGPHQPRPAEPAG